MKLFKKKAKDEEINETETAESQTAAEETLEETQEASEETAEPKKSMFRSLKFTLICCAGALVVAAALLVGTKFAIVDIIKGPAQVTDIQSAENGSFVKYRIFFVLDNYAGEDSKEIYAVIPDVNKMATINFSKRYAESVGQLMEDTTTQISSGNYAQDKYVMAQGTVAELSEEQSTKMYEWFTANKDALVATHVISDAYDAADYLSEKVLLVDTVNGMNQTMVMVLSAIAVLLVLYVIAELILMAFGFYKEPKPETEAAAEGAETVETAETAETAENSEAASGTEEKTAESDEAMQSGSPETPEDNDVGGEGKE